MYRVNTPSGALAAFLGIDVGGITVETTHETTDLDDVSLLSGEKQELDIITPETLLLTMFDIEELAELTDGERRLLKAVVEAETLGDTARTEDIDDYSPLVRALVTQPRLQRSSYTNDDPLFDTRVRRKRTRRPALHR